MVERAACRGVPRRRDRSINRESDCRGSSLRRRQFVAAVTLVSVVVVVAAVVVVGIPRRCQLRCKEVREGRTASTAAPSPRGCREIRLRLIVCNIGFSFGLIGMCRLCLEASRYGCDSIATLLCEILEFYNVYTYIGGEIFSTQRDTCKCAITREYETLFSIVLQVACGDFN